MKHLGLWCVILLAVGCSTIFRQPLQVNLPGIDLHKGTQPYERFHVQTGEPVIKTHWSRFGVTYTDWTNIYLPDGQPGEWTSVWAGNLQTYWGNVKCDGTRTRMAWLGQLGDKLPHDQWVMTTTKKEMRAVRYRKQGPGTVDGIDDWLDMGGI